jgi:HD superfamily phosphohydrolase
MPLVQDRRFRDLVHGFVYLTKAECEVVDHPLFQRLRHIRQNDVASLVYPSLNGTRFEHSLGCCHIAGRIAAQLRSTPEWGAFAIRLQACASLDGDAFERASRLYALLHDVGHLPFSHLFETALEDFAGSAYPDEPTPLKRLCTEWFGPSDFKKPHEAFGAIAAREILKSVDSVSAEVKAAVATLMGTKSLAAENPLMPLKQIVDSEVDADRIDSTARDGMLAGGEYGSYDIERLCSGVRIVCDGAGAGGSSRKWNLGYSRKALSSLEGLLLDRYRTHTWIHFHHRVVAMKCAMRVLIAKLLAESPAATQQQLFAHGAVSGSAWKFDDVWLWSELRKKDGEWTSEPEASALAAILRRDTTRVHLLWKDRLEWSDAWREVRAEADVRLARVDLRPLNRQYETEIDSQFRGNRGWAQLSMRIFTLPFKPLDERKLHLVGEAGEEVKRDLRDHSPISYALQDAWQAEPQLYAVVFGDLQCTPEKRKDALGVIRQWWARHTAAWLSKDR